MSSSTSTPWNPPANWESRPVAVLGGGVLGRRIATIWASGGHDVQVREPDEAQRQPCIDYAHENAATYPGASASRPVGQVRVYAELPDAVRDAWLVIEAVPEKLAIKEATFAELEARAPADAILATNSSSYKSSEMLGGLRDEATKTRVLNTHYYMPPKLMIVELMTCGHTAPGIFDFLVERQRAVGTAPFVVRKESTGFVFNRLWAAVKRETLTILAEGVSAPAEIDDMWRMTWAGGNAPCELMDQVGLDTVSLIEQHYVAERGLPTKDTVDFLQREYISQGKLGKKSDKGGLLP